MIEHYVPINVAYPLPRCLVPDVCASPVRQPVTDADADLVAQLQSGSEAAFRTLVERYQDRVYRTVFSLLRNPEEAEDVAQEVFVEVYQTIARFRGEAALSTWLYRLATSRALKSLRRARTKKRFAYFTNLLGLHNDVLHEPPRPRAPAGPARRPARASAPAGPHCPPARPAASGFHPAPRAGTELRGNCGSAQYQRVRGRIVVVSSPQNVTYPP
jgi:hypothetical protein